MYCLSPIDVQIATSNTEGSTSVTTLVLTRENAMTKVYVKLDDVGSYWLRACKEAVVHLNGLFKRNEIAVVLSTTGSEDAKITVKTDAGIQGDAVHGRTSAETTGAGKLLNADVRLPVKVTIN